MTDRELRKEFIRIQRTQNEVQLLIREIRWEGQQPGRPKGRYTSKRRNVGPVCCAAVVNMLQKTSFKI